MLVGRRFVERAGVGARTALASCALAAALLSPGRVGASPQDLFGYGPRTSALGGSGAALGRGFEAVWGGPALLSEERTPTVTLGLQGALFDLQANGARLPYSSLKGSFIGATLPLPFGGILRDRLTLGVGFFTPFDLVVRGRILYPEKPQHLLADRAQTVAVQAGLGADVGGGFRVGVGFMALAALEGVVLVAEDSSGRIGTVVEDTLVASYAPIGSLTFERWGYRVGLTVRGELVAPFNVVIQVKDLGDLTVPPLNISGVAQYDPLAVALEIARVRGPLRATVGVTYKRWSAYPGPAAPTVRCPTTDPATGEPFTGTCAPNVPAAPGFSDTVVPRAGVELGWPLRPSVELAGRVGYFFEPSPAPLQRGASNLFDEARSAFTWGLGLTTDAPLPGLRVDAYGQVHALHGRTHDKADGSPSVTTAGLVVAGGATLGVSFR